jgi:hypothetical protein
VLGDLVRDAQRHGIETRLTRNGRPAGPGAAQMNYYIHEDPGRLETMANMAAFATAKVGQGELARTLATLRQPAWPGQARR